MGVDNFEDELIEDDDESDEFGDSGEQLFLHLERFLDFALKLSWVFFWIMQFFKLKFVESCRSCIFLECWSIIV